MSTHRFLLLAVPTLVLPQLAAQLLPGKLAVLRVGNGSLALSSSAASVFLDQYDTTGAGQSASFSVAIPASGADALTLSGTAASEGALTRSVDRLHLTFAGYNTAAGTVSVSGTASAIVNRAVGVLDATGAFTLPARTDQGFSLSNVRSAVTVDGSAFWMAGNGGGGSGGVWHVVGTTDTQVYNTIGNLRVLGIGSGNLYFTTGASGVIGLHQIPGLPVSGGSSASQVISSPATGPYDFAISDTGTVVYIADDSTVGIQRWEKSGDTWSLAYTLGTGVANVGARGLTVDWEAANPILYAVTEETAANRLIRIEDTGAGSAAITLATAAANTVFRGVEFNPIPEPGPAALLGLGAAAMWFGLRRGPRRR